MFSINLRELAAKSGKSEATLRKRYTRCPNATEYELCMDKHNWERYVYHAECVKRLETSDRGVVNENDIIEATGASRRRVRYWMTRHSNRVELMTFREIVDSINYIAEPRAKKCSEYYPHDYTVNEIIQWFDETDKSNQEWKYILKDMCRSETMAEIKPLIEFLERRIIVNE